MTLRTPRRRVSPRTKRRYRAIKDFLRKALGNSSQPDIKTNSSIEVSVSDLKCKIIGIEQQLNKVSKHCRDLACLENSFRKVSETSLVQSQRNNDTSNERKEKNCYSGDNNKEIETKLLYKSSDSHYRKSNVSSNIVNVNSHDDRNDMPSTNPGNINNVRDLHQKNVEKKTHDKDEFHSFDNHRRARWKYKTIEPIYSTSSFQSLLKSGNKRYSKPGCSSQRYESKRHRGTYIQPLILKEHRDREIKKVLKYNEKEYDRRLNKTKRAKQNYSEVDKDFIADIIKRQYKPVKLFGRRYSDFSQFSAPVCRDQEFKIHTEIQDGSELCSCCYDDYRRKKHNYDHHDDLNDMGSICDTRLYSSKKNRRYKRTREYIDDYNNSALYDIVPVKEKSSPKSQRKFIEDNMIAYQCFKEVPPSPKSHRPRLNLKVQHYTDDENSILRVRHQSRRNPAVREIHHKVTSMTESDILSETYPQRIQTNTLKKSKYRKPVQIQEDVGTMSSLQYPNFVDEQINMPNNDTTLNTQVTDSTADKTDKTLCEIKDILRSFLLEIKKETSPSEKSDGMSKIENKLLTQHQEPKITPVSGHSFNNHSVGQCGVPPFSSAFPNSCCYPILPVCPMSCLQNGYILPSPSYTCTVSPENSKPGCPVQETCYNKIKTAEETNTNNETHELIKEIYKFVSQKPTSPRTRNERNGNFSDKTKNELRLFDKKLLTTRSVGGSSKASKHDANVGTTNTMCYSKSCEAIGCRIPSDTYNTNASYSDTILEKLSLEVTQASSESDLSNEVAEEKVKPCKFKKVWNSLRQFKKKNKKKKDVIAELRESESTVEVDVKMEPPFKQHITNYAMHRQEYYHPPPIPKQHCCRPPPPDCYGYGCESRIGYHQPSPPVHDLYTHYKHHSHGNAESSPYNPANYATAPPYPGCDAHYNQIPPQVPLCLKEIEVKSIGTQSDRKMSILQKFTKKMEPPVHQQQAPRSTAAPKQPSFWKSLQEKARQNGNDPMDFSLKTQKELAQGDVKLKNAMLKKMFYKRNPFSPRNLVIRTLLGKDKSSYGEPPKMYRPRMFL